jgi:transmembrane sensor
MSIDTITDDILIKHILGETDQEERVHVEQWLLLSNANQVRYEQYLQVWQHSKEVLPPGHITAEESWQGLQQRMTKQSQFRWSKRLIAAAATLALIMGATWLLTREQKGAINTDIATKHSDTSATLRPAPTKPLQTGTMLFATKLVIKDTLPDNSVVTLNKSTKMYRPDTFASNERRIHLSGEAFFDIAANKAKPFIIETENHVQITVVGTAFNVKSFKETTEVIVESGTVEMKYGSRTVSVRAGERAKMGKKDSIVIVQKIKDKLYKYYRSKVFECDETPLWKVVDVLNEAYGNRVTIGNANLRNLKLTTSFDNESLDKILEILSETFDISIEQKGNQYILK